MKFEHKIGFVHGRFQVLHKGHLKYFLESKKRCEHLLVGICRPELDSFDINEFDNHRSISSSNQLTYYERAMCIKGALIEAGLNESEFDIIPFPIDEPHKIFNYIPKDAIAYMTIFEPWGYEKKEILEKLGLKVIVVFGGSIEEKDYNSSDIRNKMYNNQEWKDDVPNYVYNYIKDHDIDKRIIACIKKEKEAKINENA